MNSTQRSNLTTRRTFSAVPIYGDTFTGFTVAGWDWNSAGQAVLRDSANTVIATTATGTLGFTGTLTTTSGVTSGLTRTVGGVVSAAAGVAVHDSSSEAVSAFVSIPANTVNTGTMIRVRGKVRATATVSTDTLQFRLRWGTTTLTGTSLITGTATDVANDDVMSFEFTLFGLAAAGATSAMVGFGNFTQPAGTSTVYADLKTTNFATNGALLLEATLKWSTANANSALVEMMVVEVFG